MNSGPGLKCENRQLTACHLSKVMKQQQRRPYVNFGMSLSLSICRYLFGRFKFNANIIGINMHFSLWRGKRGNEKIKLTIITPLLQWQWHTILEKKKMKLFSHWVSDTFCVFCCHHHPSDTGDTVSWAPAPLPPNVTISMLAPEWSLTLPFPLFVHNYKFQQLEVLSYWMRF